MQKSAFIALAAAACIAAPRLLPSETVAPTPVVTGDLVNLARLVRNSAWQQVLQQADASRSPQQAFLAGLAAARLSQWDNAESLLSRCLDDTTLPRDIVLSELAQAQESQKKWGPAAASWKSLFEQFPKSRLSREATLRHAQALLEAGNAKQALQALAHLPTARKRSRRSHVKKSSAPAVEAIELTRAAALERLGRADEARGVLRRLVIQACESEESESAEKNLERLSGSTQKTWSTDSIRLAWPREQWQPLGRALQKCRRFSEALAVHELLNGEDSRFAIELGKDAFGLRDYPAARKFLEPLVMGINPKHRDPEAVFWLAQTLSRTHQAEAAQVLYLDFVDRHPNRSNSHDALYALGLSYLSQRRYPNAAQAFGRLVRFYPRSKHRSKAYWFAGWSEFQQGNYDGAIRIWQHPPPQRKKNAEGLNVSNTRPHYWIARAQERSGDVAGAVKTYQRLVNEAPFHYYAYAAELRLQALQAPVSAFPQPPNLRALPQSKPIGASPLLISPTMRDRLGEGFSQRLFNLASMGLERWASADLLAGEPRLHSQNDWLELAKLYRALGEYHRSSYIARVNFQREIEHPPKSDALLQWTDLWILGYPEAWADEVNRAARRYKVPQSTIWAIMRQESSFRPDAASKAGAYGLMQLILPTAQVLAGRSVSASDVLSVDNNIDWGTKYLAALSTLFKTRLDLIAAAYNAGPERVDDWLKQNADLPPDEFIEAIPFGETCEYVKKVVAMFVDYERLYGRERPLKEIFIPLAPASVQRPDGPASAVRP